MPNIKPLNDRVLLERIEASDKTAGGILLPDSAKEKPTEGRVVATGEGRRSDKGERVPLTVKVGDRRRTVGAQISGIPGSLLRPNRLKNSAGIFKTIDDATAFAGQHVVIAVAVKIHQDRIGLCAHIHGMG